MENLNKFVDEFTKPFYSVISQPKRTKYDYYTIGGEGVLAYVTGWGSDNRKFAPICGTWFYWLVFLAQKHEHHHEEQNPVENVALYLGL